LQPTFAVNCQLERDLVQLILPISPSPAGSVLVLERARDLVRFEQNGLFVMACRREVQSAQAGQIIFDKVTGENERRRIVWDGGSALRDAQMR